MRKIKLFVDAHWFDDPFQSTCVFIKGLYTEIANDDRFELYMSAVDVELLKKEFNYSDKIHYLKYNSHSKYYRLAIDIPNLIRKHKIDIAHYQYVSPLIKNTKEIVTIHDLLFLDFTNLFPWHYRTVKNFLFKRSAKRSDLVTTVSNYSSNAIIKHYYIPKNKIILTPNGVSQDFFRDFSEAPLPDIKSRYNLKKYILYVSRIEPRKNHISLVKAYVENKIWDADTKLVLIGREDIAVKELDHYLNELPESLKQNIVQLKNIPFEELLSFYRNAALFVYPSIAEGFGIPPLEAAALKTKTLCSNSTAMSDFSFFGNDLFPPLDIETLSLKMAAKLKEDDVLRREHLSKFILENYNWKVIASNFSSDILNLFSK
ncbi:glycosyltransferase family 4 protein [Ohtaekwangia koreensis]|uniref:Glycosyltransferase involved in cell wall bisynthesis n=1 Tax=Ohtaekwangia koreensis TaxID=688867 RepID=A0A1T5IH40_9BACT|nr:glycosyltransferase family 1 protein [Ohtaekwangia koreensis]SKC38378.1 Glycosyltransferase involved in cell wall bisynthesis [Ohtaekwangia koreensis]